MPVQLSDFQSRSRINLTKLSIYFAFEKRSVSVCPYSVVCLFSLEWSFYLIKDY